MIACALACAQAVGALAAGEPQPAPPGTQWNVCVSQGFDALCALNVLSGDEYYVSKYPVEAREFASAPYEGARRAAARLKTVIKDENGGIVSALLTLLFSGGPDSTLDAVLASARHPAPLEAAFRASPYWDQDSWDQFLRVRPTIVTALEEMKQAGFVQTWESHLGVAAEGRVDSMRAELSRYDVLGEQERLVGHRLQEGRIEVVLLWYSRPHGIRVQGSRFLTNVGYSTSIVLRNAAHEPLHPPFDAVNPRVAAAIATLSQDSLLVRIVRDHDRSFGYTSIDGYIDEDAVQALEQTVSERLGIARPAGERWRQGDDGMHLLAAAIYDLMRESGFVERGGKFDEWFAEAVAAGRLNPAEIRRRAGNVVGDEAVARWSP